MKRLLVVTGPCRSERRIFDKAVEIAAHTGASIAVAGFVHEHVDDVPARLQRNDRNQVKEALVAKFRGHIEESAAVLPSDRPVNTTVEVYWEKHVAERVIRMAEEQDFDLVLKGTSCNETPICTATDWQLLRDCRAPLFLVPERQWSKGNHVMAAVDLGTRVKSKQALNYAIVEMADSVATALGCELHFGYTVPFSVVLRDLDVVSESRLLRDGERRAAEFRESLKARGIEVDNVYVALGAPEKALVNMVAKNGIGLVVLGCVGRTGLAGRVLGNTAEQILGLMKADVLAIKPNPCTDKDQ